MIFDSVTTFAAAISRSFPFPEETHRAKRRENLGGCLQPTIFSHEPLITKARVKGLWEGDTSRFGNRITEEL